MKNITIVATLFIGLISVSHAKPPKHTFSLAELTEAKAEALEKQKAVVYIYSTMDTT